MNKSLLQIAKETPEKEVRLLVSIWFEDTKDILSGASSGWPLTYRTENLQVVKNRIDDLIEFQRKNNSISGCEIICLERTLRLKEEKEQNQQEKKRLEDEQSNLFVEDLELCVRD